MGSLVRTVSLFSQNGAAFTKKALTWRCITYNKTCELNDDSAASGGNYLCIQNKLNLVPLCYFLLHIKTLHHFSLTFNNIYVFEMNFTQ